MPGGATEGVRGRPSQRAHLTGTNARARTPSPRQQFSLLVSVVLVVVCLLLGTLLALASPSDTGTGVGRTPDLPSVRVGTGAPGSGPFGPAGTVRSTTWGPTPNRPMAVGWTEVCQKCGPGELEGASMAFDNVDGYVLLFGGINSTSGAYNAATWSYRGGIWSEVCANCGPSARAWAAMTYDSADQYVVLFGGYGGSYLDDTWTYRGGTWTELCSSCAPPARDGASFVYDVSYNAALLYGGCGATCPLGDMWSYQAGTWTSVCAPSCAPPARTNASLAYDGTDHDLVLYGGTQGTSDLTDAWTFTASGWSENCAKCPLPARDGGSIAYSSTDGFVVVFGGYNRSTSTYRSDLWEELGGTVGALTLGTTPGARAYAPMVDDPMDGVLLLYGGTDGTPLADTWTFHYGLSPGTPTASPFSLDSGQSVTLSSLITGGTAPFAYSWTGLPNNCLSSNADPLSCTPSGILSNTTFPLYVQVNDSNGVRVRSPVLNLVIYSLPSLGTLVGSPASGGADSGQSLTITAPTSGGAGGYVYTWKGLPPGCTGTSYRVVSCLPTGLTVNSTYNVSANVTDRNGGTAVGAVLAYVVDSDPKVWTPIASRSTVEGGAQVNLTSKAANGSGGYVWTWTGLPPGCASQDSPALTCVPAGLAGNSTYAIAAQVADTNGFKVTSGTVPLLVITSPSLGTPVANVSSVDLGQSFRLNVTAGGGTGGYIFRWWGLPSGCSSANAPSIVCTPTGLTTNSTARIFVNLTDANGLTASSGFLFLPVNLDPVVSPVSVAPAGVDAGQNVTFSVTVTRGAGLYRFQWTGLPAGCVSSNAPQLRCSPSAALITQNTTYQVGVTVTDAAGFAVSAPTSPVEVDVLPTVSAVWASPHALDSGQTVVLSVNATGGSGAYTFGWWGLPSGCASLDLRVLTCTPTASNQNATYALWVTVTDGNANALRSPTLSLAVDSRPSVAPPIAFPMVIDLGGSSVLSTHGIGGSGHYTFTWSGPPTGCAPGNSSQFFCRPTASGTWDVEASVTDSRGVSSGPPPLSIALSVEPDPTVDAFYASQATVRPGDNTSFTVFVKGGVGPYDYVYSGLPAGCNLANSAHTYCIPQSTGSFTVHVQVTDSQGYSASAVLDWNVSSASGGGSVLGLPTALVFLVLGLVVGGLLLLLVVLPYFRRRSSDESDISEEEGAAEASPATPSDDEPAAPEGPVPSPDDGPYLEMNEEPVSETFSPSPPTGTGAFGHEVPFPGGSPHVPAPPSDLGGPSTGSVEGSGTGAASPAATAPSPPAAPVVRKCPLCGSVLDESGVCRSCELDWSKLQIEGRTDTLRGHKPLT